MNKAHRDKLVADIIPVFRDLGPTILEVKATFKVFVKIIVHYMIKVAVEGSMRKFFAMQAEDNLNDHPCNLFLRWKAMKTWFVIEDGSWNSEIIWTRSDLRYP